MFKSDSCSKVSLSIDCWTAENKAAFLGVTGSFMDTNFKLQRVLLEMIPLGGIDHTGQNLANLLVKMLRMYELNPSQISSITQDNAGNCGTCKDHLIEKHGIYQLK